MRCFFFRNDGSNIATTACDVDVSLFHLVFLGERSEPYSHKDTSK